MNNKINDKSKYIVVLDIVGLDISHVSSGLLPTISDLAGIGECGYLTPVFPSVTSTVQSSVLSEKYPNQHGIISNGLYDRENYQVSFWEQSSKLVKSERIWDILKKKNNDLKTSILFWQNTMFANSEFVITPRPIHLENGQMDMWCYSRPPGYYEEVSNIIGEFDLYSYWGPFASFKSTEWISKSVEYTLEKYKPNLLFAYFPQLDYSSQKFGKNSTEVKVDLEKIDEVVSSIIKKTKKLGIFEETEFIVFSEYGFNDVNDGISINKLLREKGYLAIRTIKNNEYIDFEYSKAFAMVDHQIANIYIKNPEDKNFVKEILEEVKGIEKICDDKEKRELKIDHSRSGDLIAISNKDKWFSYYWWFEDNKAPTFTKTVDIHRKPGYDPLELFVDFKTKSIPFETTLVKGSHGRPFNLETKEGLSTFISTKKIELDNNKEHFINDKKILNCINLFDIIYNNFS
ncbi:MAG TPA: alkaline phosphatase family protein [Candidatus Sulfopaludibacter sp.]|nr:alkaline phosphatase family protein [Candidatus Sulfopaludibacter sp.]